MGIFVSFLIFGNSERSSLATSSRSELIGEDTGGFGVSFKLADGWSLLAAQLPTRSIHDKSHMVSQFCTFLIYALLAPISHHGLIYGLKQSIRSSTLAT